MKKLFLIWLGLLLTACAPAPQPGAQHLTREQRHGQLSVIHNWNLIGAFSVRQGGQATMANMRWQQQGNRYYQTISGPFSLGGVDIIGQPGRVTMQKSPSEIITASSPESLLMQHFGWELPISNLYYWIRGIPVPGAPISAQKYDADNHLVFLQQRDWTVQYTAFQNVNGIDLPRTILVNNHDLQAKIVISRWQIM